MMFALRGIAVSLTFFVLIYCLLSALVVIAWRVVRVLRLTARGLAGLLFALRILPLAASVVITLAFVVPSFQILEPRSADEGMGALPLALGICALLLIADGCLRVITAQVRTTHAVSAWLRHAHPLDAGLPAATLQSQREAPPLMLVGVRAPRVLVSETTVELLTKSELQIALRHEFAHMQSRDNLKKLICRFCPFPGMAALESAWSQAAEIAADDAAVAKVDDAIDLAAALVKLSRLVPVEVPPVCTVGFVTGSLSARVTRLLAWDGAAKSEGVGVRSWKVVAPVLALMFCVFATYGPVLALTHEATEWLVR